MSASTIPMSPPSSGDILAEVEALGTRIGAVRAQIGRAIYGQTEVVDQTLITLLSGGHVLLVGVPGLGKSRLVETLGTVLGLGSKRVQFTPDLMPGDITGSEVLDEAPGGQRSFRFVPGPVFCQLLMADEINRASPRTQSALLQAMQEGRVAVGGVEHPLPRPFHVLATQNPIEQEGTYPLPEAQLDRFLLEVRVTYPDLVAERAMLVATTGAAEAPPVQALTAEELVAAQALIRRVPVGETVVDAILKLVRGGRPETARGRGGAQACRLGPRPARRPGADAGHPRPGAAGRPAGAEHRRRGGPGPAGAAPPHGAEFFRPRRRPGAGGRDRPAGRDASGEPVPIRGCRRLARPGRQGAPRRWAPGCRRCWWPPNASPPPSPRACMAAGAWARATVSGSSAPSCPATPPPASTGANPPAPTAPSSARRSGKRRRPSICGATARPACAGARARASTDKIERAELLLLALASLLLRGGERVRLLGAGRAAGRAAGWTGWPPSWSACPTATACRRMSRVPRHARVVLIGDLLAPLEQIQAAIGRLAAIAGRRTSAAGARPRRGAAAL